MAVDLILLLATPFYFSQGSRVKIVTSPVASERMFSSWIGGSILASLGNFQSKWFSKAEWQEEGIGGIMSKCA